MSLDSSQRRKSAARSASDGHTPVEPLPAVSAENIEACPPRPDERTEAGPTPSNPGEQLPFPDWERYKLITFLGAGGMGSVYKALDPRLGRLVAIKFLRSHHLEADQSRQRRRFEREARAQASLDHPHICKIFEVGEVDGTPYIAMELISGSPLGAIHESLTLDDKLRIIAQVAEALQCAHELGLIHRDIKPRDVSAVEKQSRRFPARLNPAGKGRYLISRPLQTFLRRANRDGCDESAPSRRAGCGC